MKKQRIIEEMGRLEYGERFSCVQSEGGSKVIWVKNPIDCRTCDYLNSHDACQRVIDGMPPILAREYCKLIGCYDDYYGVWAKPAQKCEAVLKIYGKWED